MDERKDDSLPEVASPLPARLTAQDLANSGIPANEAEFLTASLSPPALSPGLSLDDAADVSESYSPKDPED